MFYDVIASCNSSYLKIQGNLRKQAQILSVGAGYTLVEILVVLSILSILAAFSFTFISELMTQHDQALRVSHLLKALQYARMESIRYGEIAYFCGSSDLKNCDGAWEKSQIVKIKDKVLRVFSLIKMSDHLSFQGSFGINQYLAFEPTGFTHGQQGSFYFGSGKRKNEYRIVVSYAGTIRIEKVASTDS